MNRTYKESIDPLVKQMIDKLLAKEDEKRHWSCSNIRSLLNLLQAEVKEAENAFNDCDPESLMEEVVDIANFCMMIHDKLNLRLVEFKEVEE